MAPLSLLILIYVFLFLDYSCWGGGVRNVIKISKRLSWALLYSQLFLSVPVSFISVLSSIISFLQVTLCFNVLTLF